MVKWIVIGDIVVNLDKVKCFYRGEYGKSGNLCFLYDDGTMTEIACGENVGAEMMKVIKSLAIDTEIEGELVV